MANNNVTTYPRDITMGPTWWTAVDSTIKSDTAFLPRGVRALEISATGNIVVTGLDMDDADSVTIAVGSTGRWVGQIKRLWDTGTTATVSHIAG